MENIRNTQIIDRRSLKADRMIQREDSELTTLNGRLRRFVQLEKERRELEARVDLIKQEADTLKEQIGDELEDLKAAGLDSKARVDGLTVFLKYQTWARPRDQDMPRLCAAMAQSGIEELEELVHPTVDLKKLSAVVKGRLEEAVENDIPDDQIFPEEVMDALHISTTRYVQSRIGKSEKKDSEE